uniref:Uncharacterized protein n=1 Tax=Arundo donax TaxID=35708 RepID=A0A0A9F8F7_ARUDO
MLARRNSQMISGNNYAMP